MLYLFRMSDRARAVTAPAVEVCAVLVGVMWFTAGRVCARWGRSR